jgi:hypothetical protein
MFEPSQHDVRRFFCSTFAKMRSSAVTMVEPKIPLTPLERIAAQWITQHPEYHDELADVESALAADYSIDRGRVNPFLHLSMHLSISEQVSIDQPPGIKQAFELLAARRGEHEAHHAMMDCLGEMLWTSQREGKPPDGAAYIDCIRRKALV